MRLRVAMLIVGLAATLAVRPVPVQAHHSVANFWEVNENITVTGVVTRISIVNPHPSLLMDVTEDGQTVRYLAILGQSVARMAGMGLTKAELAPGTTLVVDGHPPKSAGAGNTKGILVFAFTFENGEKIVLGDEPGALGRRR